LTWIGCRRRAGPGGSELGGRSGPEGGLSQRRNFSAGGVPLVDERTMQAGREERRACGNGIRAPAGKSSRAARHQARMESRFSEGRQMVLHGRLGKVRRFIRFSRGAGTDPAPGWKRDEISGRLSASTISDGQPDGSTCWARGQEIPGHWRVSGHGRQSRVIKIEPGTFKVAGAHSLSRTTTRSTFRPWRFRSEREIWVGSVRGRTASRRAFSGTP